MPGKVNWGVAPSGEPDPDAVGMGYFGELPPLRKEGYRCNLKWLQLKLDKNNDVRISGPAEIDEDGDLAEYNGYTFWVGQSINDDQRSLNYLAALARAIGVSWSDILNKTTTVDKEFTNQKGSRIAKIGRKIPEDIEIIIIPQEGSDQHGNPRMEPAQFYPKDWELGDGDEDEDEEWEDDEDDEDEDDADEDEDDDEQDEDDADEDEDEEPEPPKRSKKAAAKRPAKKVASKKAAAGKRRRPRDEEDDEPPF